MSHVLRSGARRPMKVAGCGTKGNWGCGIWEKENSTPGSLMQGDQPQQCGAEDADSFWRDEVFPNREFEQVQVIVQAKILYDLVFMKCDGARGKFQSSGGFFHRQASGEQLKNFALSTGKNLVALNPRMFELRLKRLRRRWRNECLARHQLVNGIDEFSAGRFQSRKPASHSRRASTATLASSFIATIRSLVLGSNFLSFRPASMPFKKGRPISTTIRSGWNCHAATRRA